MKKIERNEEIERIEGNEEIEIKGRNRMNGRKQEQTEKAGIEKNRKK